MGKFGRLFLKLIILGVMIPMIYYFVESYTAPVGHVSTDGVTTYTTGGLFVAEHIWQNGAWVDNPYTVAPTATTIGGVSTQTLALIGAIPWALPLFVLVYAIVDFVKPEKPEGMQ
jgi:hypothetical protein